MKRPLEPNTDTLPTQTDAVPLQFIEDDEHEHANTAGSGEGVSVRGSSEVVSVASASDTDTDQEVEQNLVALGLDRSTLGSLSRQLGVPLALAPVETLAYSLSCQQKRGDVHQKTDVLDVWAAIPKRYKLRDGDSSCALVTVFGVNPRNTKVLTKATSSLPNTFEFLCGYVKSLMPGFKFSCLALRENCQKGPHRDTRNIGSSFVVRLTTDHQGGDLWVADSQGHVLMSHQGHQVKGRIQCILEPYVFSARTHLHATEPWQRGRRVILVAFTPIGTLSLQSDFCPYGPKQSRISDFFHVANHSD